ncbi:Cullin-associated Nedd8-dissociated protein 1 [Trichinella pseudospiralis]|uniref:Cullin-associated Nedd8-dissociated protein 1 n=1 Tax=Trichinella pseudospiralis TaxID=6337 RepID=A0A0V1EMC5_TRIPS|nr:Cullin-associated Nedd8-dissociated protein 1 [Trichinella pseudospiralis]
MKLKLTTARKLFSIPFFIGMSWKAKLDISDSVVMISICIFYFLVTEQMALESNQNNQSKDYCYCNMSAVSYYIAHLLERMNSTDKDFRFMATNDLMRELQKEITLDVDSENKMVEMLLKLLEDKNTEVQNLAVRCMGPLIRKVKDAQAANVTCILSANLRSESSQKRDVSSSALKTIINELPPAESAVTVAVLNAIMPALLSILSSADADMSVLLECLDMVNSVLGRFPSVVGHHYSAIECTVLPLLEFDRAPVRKRAILVLSTLSGICDNAVLEHLGKHLLNGLSSCLSESSSVNHRTYIACTGAVCKSAGSRLGSFLSKALPAIVHYCKEMQDDEIRESCFAAFEQVLLFCLKQCDETVVDEILKLATIYIAYDPNYQYDYEMQDASMELDNDDVVMDSELSGEEYSDDDDMSWKVRRAAAKCLEAAVNTRRNRICEFHQKIVPKLIERFKEREESVRCDLFNVLLSLLKRTRIYFQYSSKSIAEKDQKTIIASLEYQMPALIVPLQRHLGGKSYKTKQAVFSVLSELQALAPQVLTPFLGSLLLNVRSTLSEKQAVGGVKIDALIFLRSAMTAQTLDVVALQIPVIAPLLRQCIQDAYYKVSAEALAVVQKLLTLIRNGDGGVNLAAYLDNMRDLYNCILAKLKDTCLDREVKEPSIMCVALYIATFGDLLQDGMDEGLQMLFDRIKNELTRLVGVRAFTVILKSPLNLSLQSVIGDLVVELTTFLRKTQRSLRVDSLELLQLIFQRCNSTQLASHYSEMVQNLVLELAPLLGQGDLQLATLAADNLTLLMPIAPEFVLDNYRTFVDPAIALLRSPLLSGHYLNKLIVFFQQFWQQANKLEKITFQEFKQLLLAPVAGEPRPHNFAKCFAALILIQPDYIKPTVAELCRELDDSSNCPDVGGNEQARQFSLLTLGEIGALCSMALNDLNVEGIVMNAFENPDERVKEAASQALGRVGTGNLARYLPFIIQQIQQSTKQQYLFMLSLLEIINHFVSTKSPEPLQQYVEFIWNVSIYLNFIFIKIVFHSLYIYTYCVYVEVLLNHAECNEEAVRNVIAECLGKLCLLQPANLLPQLRSNLSISTNINVRNTLTSSIKYTMSDQMPGIDEYLKDCIGDFFQMLKDSDLNIRRIAFLTFNSFVHNKPELMRDHLSNLLPIIYSETAVRKELIREVDMGPFKHVMDDGLHLRKAAFECMYTLLDNCFDCLDVFEFLNHVVQGLKDHYDIKILTFLIVIRLTTLCPNELLQRLINIVEPLKQVCLTKLKTNSVKQEYELQDELKRSALRAVIAIQNLPTAGKHPVVVELMNIINQTPELLNLYENVRWDPLTSKH